MYMYVSSFLLHRPAEDNSVAAPRDRGRRGTKEGKSCDVRRFKVLKGPLWVSNGLWGAQGAGAADGSLILSLVGCSSTCRPVGMHGSERGRGWGRGRWLYNYIRRLGASPTCIGSALARTPISAYTPCISWSGMGSPGSRGWLSSSKIRRADCTPPPE